MRDGLPARARCDLLLDQFDRAAMQIFRRHDQLSPVVPLRVARQQIEQRRGVLPMSSFGREQPQVGVNSAVVWIVVAGAQMHVATKHVAFLADDQRQFAMRLQVEKAEHHVHARSLHLSCPADVVAPRRSGP